jgi:hypothetical protein
MSQNIPFRFLENAAQGAENIARINLFKTLALQVDAPGATAFEVKVSGAVDCEQLPVVWYPLAAVDMSDMTTHETITEEGVYLFYVGNHGQVKAEVVSATGGTVSVLGRFLTD